MLTRRTAILAPLAAAAAIPAIPARAAGGKMSLSLHQTTSLGAGFRKSLEGWSKAGIKNVEINDLMLDEFLKTDTLAAARSLLKDLGLTVISSSARQVDLYIPGATQVTALEGWKKRCELFASLGAQRIYSPAVTTRKVTAEDYKGAPDCIRQFGDVAKQNGIPAMIEFTRISTFIATLPTALKLIREAAHPNVHPMLDCYHFWSGLSKFEDLDMIRPGEIAHMHFQDVPDMPRELMDNTTRLIPGDGVSPLVQILRKMSEKGYTGALSVELFLPEFQQADPYELAKRIQEKSEAVMRKAKVI
jgi:sugar phosphate isomerase/epimerase